MLAGSIHLVQSQITCGPMGSGHLPHDDADVLGPGIDGPQHRFVHLVHHGADLFRVAALGEGDLDQWHV